MRITNSLGSARKPMESTAVWGGIQIEDERLRSMFIKSTRATMLIVVLYG
jgi:hypothetical protein